MKSILLTVVSFLLVSFLPVSSRADNPGSSRVDNKLENVQLQKEIQDIFRKGNLKHMSEDTQEVTIRFLINAQHEVIIFDATGDSDAACDHVKEVLNYRQIKFKQAKQLVPYEISILFVKNNER